MKRTGKIAAVFITALTAVASITACSADYSHIDGYSDIENARKLYSSLYSAEITVTDKQTGTVTQELTFCYDKSDTLSYSYFGTDGKTKYYEYAREQNVPMKLWSRLQKGGDHRAGWCDL